ncbi:hypothetical protein [Methylogaea oryzae]|uniref:hypothetical protein n=1 Tax=Methylogaea oryzae TaxID=1295382 RepID=UPI0006CFF048|nr:hypothetical protein [Methylogaea oryzae]
MSAVDPLAGWVPMFLSGRGGVAAVEWGYMGGERYTEPFCQARCTSWRPNRSTNYSVGEAGWSCCWSGRTPTRACR